MIHAASVGEVIALRPFILRVLESFSSTPVTVTTFTPTGSDQVKKTFADRVQHCFLPIDSPTCVARFLTELKPKAIVLMETEIWPNLLQQAHQKNIRTLLINGRLSERSFPKYQKIHALVSNALSKIDLVLTQSKEDAERFVALGSKEQATEVMGNLKYDITPANDLFEKAQSIKNDIGERPVWVIGSTHEDEEALYIEAIQQLLTRQPNTLVIIAPRHVERVQPLCQLLTKHDLKFVKRSDNVPPNKQHSIWLIDTLGELMLFYAIADLAFVAGSFDNTGGHNPLEPAALKKAVICGPNMRNFQEITAQLLEKNGMLQVNTAEELVEVTDRLLCEKESAHYLERKELGENAYHVVKQNQGATENALLALRKLL